MYHIMATSKACRNIYFLDQHYQPGKITSQVFLLMFEYLVAVSYELWMVQYNLYLCF